MPRRGPGWATASKAVGELPRAARDRDRRAGSGLREGVVARLPQARPAAGVVRAGRAHVVQPGQAAVAVLERRRNAVVHASRLAEPSSWPFTRPRSRLQADLAGATPA